MALLAAGLVGSGLTILAATLPPFPFACGGACGVCFGVGCGSCWQQGCGWNPCNGCGFRSESCKCRRKSRCEPKRRVVCVKRVIVETTCIPVKKKRCCRCCDHRRPSCGRCGSSCRGGSGSGSGPEV